MKSHIAQRWQSLLSATIATIILLGASSSTSAQSKPNSPWTFAEFSSKVNHNTRFDNGSGRFEFRGILSNNLFAANFITADDFPKPDFSEMEQYFGIVKYEYDILNRKLNIIVKSKKETRPTSTWRINFYDADGVTVIDENGITGLSMFTPVGQPEKAFFYTPFESQMKRVKTVVVTRKVE